MFQGLKQYEVTVAVVRYELWLVAATVQVVARF
jgi:hypothetical protein